MNNLQNNMNTEFKGETSFKAGDEIVVVGYTAWETYGVCIGYEATVELTAMGSPAIRNPDNLLVALSHFKVEPLNKVTSLKENKKMDKGFKVGDLVVVTGYGPIATNYIKERIPFGSKHTIKKGIGFPLIIENYGLEAFIVEHVPVTPRHKHADLMIAYANNTDLVIQARLSNSGWSDCADHPLWHDYYEYRIKPDNTVKWAAVYSNCSVGALYSERATAVNHCGVLSILRFEFEVDTNQLISCTQEEL